MADYFLYFSNISVYFMTFLCSNGRFDDAILHCKGYVLQGGQTVMKINFEARMLLF